MAKPSHIGAPAVFALELACRQINEAFEGDNTGHCYLVGSVLERQDWRDVDVRFVMDDAAFADLFPDALDGGRWEADPRWLLLTTALSKHLSYASGLPVDFQFQPQSHANKHHDGPRHALGMILPRATPAGRAEKEG